MFVARPPAGPPSRARLRLVRGAHGTGAEPTEFLADAGNRARVGEYLADMTRPYGLDLRQDLFRRPCTAALGQSYGELAQPLIGQAVSADEPVDLLILAFAVHDLRPGRQTAAYLSSLTSGAPLAFAICDQGSAAAFSGLRVAAAYAASAAITRALLITVEQAALPYDCPVPLPAGPQAVAMLYRADTGSADSGSTGTGSTGTGSDGTGAGAGVTAVRQHPGVRPAGVAELAAADLKDLAASHREITVLLSASLAAHWPAPEADRIWVTPPGQPSTGIWCGLLGELARPAGHADLLVAADYDVGTGCLSLAAFDA